MRKTTKAFNYFIDTYELGLSDLEWGLGYPVAEYTENKKLMRYSIEQNLLGMIIELHPDSEVSCIQNEWNKDNTKLTIKFEIRKEK